MMPGQVPLWADATTREVGESIRTNNSNRSARLPTSVLLLVPGRGCCTHVRVQYDRANPVSRP
jgi:hypothetical protein